MCTKIITAAIVVRNTSAGKAFTRLRAGHLTLTAIRYATGDLHSRWVPGRRRQGVRTGLVS